MEDKPKSLTQKGESEEGSGRLGFLDGSTALAAMDAQRALLDELMGTGECHQIPRLANAAAPRPNPTPPNLAVGGDVVCSSQLDGGGEEGAQGAEVGRSRRVRPLHGPVLPARPLHQHQEQPRYGRSPFPLAFCGGFCFTDDKFGCRVCRHMLEDPRSQAQGEVRLIMMLI